MKKILCLILIFTLLFCVSCNVADGGDILSDPPSESTPEVSESSKPDESSSNLEETLPPEESNNFLPEESSDKANETDESDIGEGYGEVETPTFSMYEEYLEFIGNAKNLPDDFITYDMLKDLGTFKSFILSSSSFNYYIYNFIDENGVTIAATINPLKNESETYPIVVPDNINNLRKASYIGVSSRYSHNNVTYGYYFNGKLATIRWAMGTTLVILSTYGASNTFADYPLDGETTFVSQLLSTQTATAAIEVFNQKVEAELAKNIADKQSKG